MLEKNIAKSFIAIAIITLIATVSANVDVVSKGVAVMTAIVLLFMGLAVLAQGFDQQAKNQQSFFGV